MVFITTSVVMRVYLQNCIFALVWVLVNIYPSNEREQTQEDTMVLFTIKHPHQDYERKNSLIKNGGEKIKHAMDGMKG